MQAESHQAKPIDALLACYSSGGLTPALHALVASHLIMSPANRAFVATLEDACSNAFGDGAITPMNDRAAALAAIFASAESVAKSHSSTTSILPAPLRDLIGCDLPQIKWRATLPGVKQYRIAAEIGGEAILYWIKAGRKIPFHTHDGLEATLVLQGGFHDAIAHYERGDIAIADMEVDHQPIADLGEDCLCFAVTDAPLRLTGPVGRIVERLFGHRH